MDQFDAAWKLLAGNHPEAFLRLFAPDLAAKVDWNQQYCLPDHELVPPAPDSRSATRHPDILLLVTLLDGSPACLHVEIQCCRDEDFARRMAIYHSRLHDRFAVPVISIALLADAGLRWRPDIYRDERDGCGMTVRFQTVKLLDFRSRLGELTTSRNPAAFAAATHLLALQTRNSSERRHAAKLRMLRQLFAGNRNVQELSDLGQILDLMMPTPWKWQKEASMDIYELYDANKHADKNSFAYAFWELTDKRGRMKGRAEGRVEGRAEGRVEGRTEAFCEARDSLAALVEQQLATRFGSLPASAINALGEATEEQLEQLALALLRVRTLDDALVVSGLIA